MPSICHCFGSWLLELIERAAYAATNTECTVNCGRGILTGIGDRGYILAGSTHGAIRTTRFLLLRPLVEARSFSAY